MEGSKFILVLVTVKDTESLNSSKNPTFMKNWRYLNVLICLMC